MDDATMSKGIQTIKELALLLGDENFRYELGIFTKTEGRMATIEFKEYMAKLQSILDGLDDDNE